MKLLIKKLQILLLLTGIIFPMSVSATQNRIGGLTNENVIRYLSEHRKMRAEKQKSIRRLAEIKGKIRTILGNEQLLSNNSVAGSKEKIFAELKILKEAKRKKAWLEKQVQRNVRAQKDNRAAQVELSGLISIDSAESTGSISGTVTDTAGAGIGSLGVFVYDDYYNGLASASTDASGTYTATGLPVGNYRVLFNTYGTDYVAEWYDGKADFYAADSVAVTAGATSTGIDAVLELGGSISGTVTDTTGAGIGSLGVFVYDDDYNWLGSASTDASGTYTVTGLSAGDRRVKFNTYEVNYVSEWYNDKADFYAADSVAVTVGATSTGIDAVLELGGSISGTVTDTTGAGIGWLGVFVHDDDYNWLGSASTDASGTYTVIGLSAGDRHVQFDTYGTDYVAEWYDDAPQLECSTPITVTTGSTVAGIDAVLDSGNNGSISGTVTNSTGAGISWVRGVVYDEDYNYLGSAYTDINGNYMVFDLPVGNYRVQFETHRTSYLSEWYNDKADFYSADAVAVTAGATSTGIDAVLDVGGSISGTVTDTAGAGIGSLGVGVYDDDYNWLGSASTDASGTYTVIGLSAGDHRVKFDTYGTDYISEWYNDKADFYAADSVAVTVGATSTGIDAVLEVGGSISGTVIDTAGAGIGSLLILVYDDDYNLLASPLTDASGMYTATGLPVENYRVEFYTYGTDYISEWYNDKADFYTADPVAVVAGAATAGINASLEKLFKGGISGKVTKGGQAFKCTQVRVYDADYNGVGYDLADYQGNYLIEGLETDSYKVQFYNQYKDLTLWYDKKKDFNNADQVNVIAPDVTTGIDAFFLEKLTITPILMLLLL